MPSLSAPTARAVMPAWTLQNCLMTALIPRQVYLVLGALMEGKCMICAIAAIRCRPFRMHGRTLPAAIFGKCRLPQLAAAIAR